MGSRLHARLIACGLLLAVFAALPTNARAYRTLADEPRTRSDLPIVWSNADVDLTIADPDGRIADRAALETALQGALDAWSSVRCSMFVPAIIAETAGTAVPGDGVNTVEIVASGWADRGFGENRGATTDLQLTRSLSGRWSIVEADLYLNFDTFEWAVGRDAREAELDLQGVLTHELGHVAGLVHPCGDSGAPSCDSSAEHRQSALYPDYLGASQRILGADDVEGICVLYPAPTACDCDDPGVCRTSIECVRECGCTNDCDSTCSCAADTDCPLGLSCALEGDEAGSCVDARSFGASCSQGEDCRSGLCLTRNGESYCTAACRESTDCPSGHECSPVQTVRVCTPVSTPTCSIAPGSLNRGGYVMTMLLLTCGTLFAARRRQCVNVATAMLLSAAVAGCGAAETTGPDAGDLPGDSGSMDAASATSDSGENEPPDAGSEPDTGVDAGETDVGDDPDAGPVDVDGDGVPVDRDCDDENPATGETAERSCASACGDGVERCAAGAWVVCDAPTDCLCHTPGATRVVTCGNCGQASESCTDGVWLQGTCLFEGECSPGATEMQPETDNWCREVVRLCQSTCAWSDWTPVGTRGECRRWDSNCTGTPEAWRCNTMCMFEPHPLPGCRGES